MDKELLEKTVKDDISKEQAKAYVKAMASVISGAVVLATHEKVTDKELKIAQDLGESVVVNNALKGFDAKVEFAKGIYQGGTEKVWDDLKALGLALNSPIETAKALMNMLNSDAIKSLATEQYNDLVDKYNNVYSALISDTEYEGEKANQAGKDLGALAVSVLEAYSGLKAVSTGVNSVREVLAKAVKTDTFASVPKKLDYVTSSGVKLEANPNKTTTVLGSYREDMGKILDETKYPKTLDFEAKQGGFNILNVPDSSYKGLSSQEFWDKFNKPFLDKAIERGDDIVLATKPDSELFDKKVNGVVVEERGFGREYRYLNSKGYVYDAQTNKMINPLK